MTQKALSDSQARLRAIGMDAATIAYCIRVAARMKVLPHRIAAGAVAFVAQRCTAPQGRASRTPGGQRGRERQ